MATLLRGRVCQKCKKTVLPPEVVWSDGFIFHIKCFVCEYCFERVDKEDALVRGGKLYCFRCFLGKRQEIEKGLHAQKLASEAAFVKNIVSFDPVVTCPKRRTFSMILRQRAKKRREKKKNEIEEKYREGKQIIDRNKDTMGRDELENISQEAIKRKEGKGKKKQDQTTPTAAEKMDEEGSSDEEEYEEKILKDASTQLDGKPVKPYPMPIPEYRYRQKTRILSPIDLDNCFRCGEPISAAERRLGGGRAWHFRCFVCFKCQKQLDSLSLYAEYHGQLFCKRCFCDIFGKLGLEECTYD